MRKQPTAINVHDDEWGAAEMESIRVLGHVFGPIPGWYMLLLEDRAASLHTVADVVDRGVKFELRLAEFVQRKYYFRSFERRELRFLRLWLRSGDIIVDVGANVGLLALHAASKVGPGGQVLAVEPVPSNLRGWPETST